MITIPLVERLHDLALFDEFTLEQAQLVYEVIETLTSTEGVAMEIPEAEKAGWRSGWNTPDARDAHRLLRDFDRQAAHIATLTAALATPEHEWMRRASEAEELSRRYGLEAEQLTAALAAEKERANLEDSWRRVAERCETEKQAAESSLAALRDRVDTAIALLREADAKIDDGYIARPQNAVREAIALLTDPAPSTAQPATVSINEKVHPDRALAETAKGGG